MGCDIHMAVEQFDFVGETSKRKWQLAIGRDGSFGERNYELFSILAGVRAHENSPPVIVEPRGLPSDISKEAKSEVEVGDHTFSFVTLAEVRAYQWARSILRTGKVDALNAQRIFSFGAPHSWCADIGGHSIRHVAEAEMRELVGDRWVGHPCLDPANPHWLKEATDDRELPAKLRGVWTQLSWHACLKDSCCDFLSWLKGLESTRLQWVDPRHVRFVFGFDS